MKNSRRPVLRSERGGAALAAAVAFVYFGFCGLVTDAGIILITRTQVQNALDAGVLAAAQELPDTTLATTLANTYVAQNLALNPMQHNLQVNVSFPQDRHVIVTAEVDVDQVFLRILGLNQSKVSASSRAERIDPDLELIVDRSGSMCEDSHGIRLNCPQGPVLQPMQDVKNAATLFAQNIDPGVNMGLVSYSTQPTTDQVLTSSHALVQQAIQGIHATGYTDIGGAINEAVQDVVLNGRADHPKVIVLITDGRPNVINGQNMGYVEAPRQHSRDAAMNARAAGAVIFSIAFGNTADQALLQDLANITGGIFYLAPTASDLVAVFQDIADRRLVRLVDVSDGLTI